MERNNRKSSIELLKIIAMFLICISHNVNVIVYDNFIGRYDPLSFNYIVFALIKNVGWIGDFIFITCSTYYLVDYKKLNIKKIIFYYLDGSLIFTCYLFIFKLFNLPFNSSIEKSALNGTLIEGYWFIVYYIMFLVILPLLNIVISKLPKKLHKILCWLTIPAQTFVLYKCQIGEPPLGHNLTLFSFMLLIMSYGKKYGTYLFFKENDKKGLLIGLFGSIAYWIIKNIVVTYMIINHKGFINSTLNACCLECYVYYIMGITLFLLFKNLNIKQSKVINYIASLSLIFYLSHHNGFISTVLDPYLSQALTSTSKLIHVPVFLLVGICRFIIGIIISIIYERLVHYPLSCIVYKRQLFTKKSLE